MNIIKFTSDTKHRKQWFTGISFSHPAKMSLPLQLWLIENFTKEGEIILDPMAGSGTILVACSMGRNVIAVELEQKFVEIMKGNWAKIQQRGCQMGYSMGAATILQGDARNLTGILVDKCIFSPPFADQQGATGASNSQNKFAAQIANDIIQKRKEGKMGGHYASKEAIERAWAKRKLSPDDIDNIGNLPYGNIDKIITSPPYEGSVSASTGGERDQSSARQREARLKSKGYDPVKYQGGVGRNLEVDFQYSKTDDNIGNLKSDSYLQAMLQVYQQCYSVLKDGGLMVLVTKNFIRNKQQVRLDLDTIKLCEQAGFIYQDRWYRELASQSFWRIIYHQKYPDVEPIKHEDILVFKK